MPLKWKIHINESDVYNSENKNINSDMHYLNLPYVKKIVEEYMYTLDTGANLEIYSGLDEQNSTLVASFGFMRV